MTMKPDDWESLNESVLCWLKLNQPTDRLANLVAAAFMRECVADEDYAVMLLAREDSGAVADAGLTIYDVLMFALKMVRTIEEEKEAMIESGKDYFDRYIAGDR